MKIIIDDNTRLCDIQDAFRKQFPYLKIEFFRLKKGKEKSFSAKNMITTTKQTTAAIREIKGQKIMSFNGHLKISTVEINFRRNHGMHAQVFRKSGNLWLETSTSDNLTLAKLNKNGIVNMVNNGNEAPAEFESYHEQL